MRYNPKAKLDPNQVEVIPQDSRFEDMFKRSAMVRRATARYKKASKTRFPPDWPPNFPAPPFEGKKKK